MKIFFFIELFNPPHIALDGIGIENGSFSNSQNFFDFIIVKYPCIAFYDDVSNRGFFRNLENNRFATRYALSLYPNVVKVTHFIDGF